MALADLWDNLKSPGFIPSAIDDMKDLAEELKDIVVDFIEGTMARYGTGSGHAN